MAIAKPIIVLALATAVSLPGCARNKDNGMMNLRSSGSGPDEFAILPTKPLVQPTTYAELPDPTPGGTNLADPTPISDAVAALGGKPALLDRAGVSRGDQGVISAASRYGVQSDIRTALASEDAEYRSKNRGKLLERWFGVSVYFSAYEKQALDRYAELERLRRAGVRTPAAPPETVDN